MIVAFVPLFIMYTIWIYGTATDRISTPLEMSRIQQQKQNNKNKKSLRHPVAQCDDEEGMAEPLISSVPPADA